MRPKSPYQEGVKEGFDFDARYRYGKLAVAWKAWGWAQVWAPCTALVVDEDGREREVEDPDGEGDWYDDTSRVLVCMVGDDRYETADRDDLIKIDDLDYCAECGQIGCRHDGRDREERQ